MKLNQIDGNNKVMQSILKIVAMDVVVFKWHKMELLKISQGMAKPCDKVLYLIF